MKCEVYTIKGSPLGLIVTEDGRRIESENVVEDLLRLSYARDRRLAKKK